MKRRLLWLLAVLLCLLTACGKENAMLTKIVFDRGHGSAWGNQLYLELCPEEIVILRRVGSDGQLQTLEHIPITQETWQQLEKILADLTLQEESTSVVRRLFGGKAVDGGLYRRLIVTYGEREVSCRWPENGDALEKYLEQLAQEGIQ